MSAHQAWLASRILHGPSLSMMSCGTCSEEGALGERWVQRRGLLARDGVEVAVSKGR